MTTPNKKAEPYSGEKEPVSDSHSQGQMNWKAYLDSDGIYWRIRDMATNRLIARDLTEVDARLIAAAPELLDACKFFIGAIEDGDLVRDITKDNDPSWAMNMMKFATDLGKAASAISRAEGRAS